MPYTSLRDLQNKPGVSFDSLKTTVLFAEDFAQIKENFEDHESRLNNIGDYPTVWAGEYNGHYVNGDGAISHFTDGMQNTNTYDENNAYFDGTYVYLQPGKYRFLTSCWSDDIVAGLILTMLAGYSTDYWSFAYFTYLNCGSNETLANLHQGVFQVVEQIADVGDLNQNPEGFRVDSPICPATKLVGDPVGSYYIKSYMRIQKIS